MRLRPHWRDRSSDQARFDVTSLDETRREEDTMTRATRNLAAMLRPLRNVFLSAAGLTLIVAATSLTPTPANAVVYCRTVGIPQGCVVRRVAPVARAVARPGRPMNRGGPVNRVGRRGTLCKQGERFRPRSASRPEETGRCSAFFGQSSLGSWRASS